MLIAIGKPNATFPRSNTEDWQLLLTGMMVLCGDFPPSEESASWRPLR